MNANSHSSFVPQFGQNFVLGANKTVQFGHFEVKGVVDSIGIVDSFVGLFTSVDIFFIIALVGIPYLSWVGFRMVSSMPVPGANDNLSGVVVASAVLKYFAQHRPENVELWAVAFGSEEGGMMGSKNMARDVRIMRDHKWFPGQNLWVVNLDGVGANGPVQITTKEPMYRVKACDPAVYNALASAAKTAGVDYYVKTLSYGGTDFGKSKKSEKYLKNNFTANAFWKLAILFM